MDFDSLVDDAKKTTATAQTAPTQSFDALQDDSEKYGDFKGELKAAGLGAVRSASFGLSDEFLVRSGAMTPEALQAYKEQNPTASTLGELGGVVGAVLAPEAGLLGALSAPVKAVARAGGAITEAVLPAAGRIAGAVASAEASPIINKVLSQAAAGGIGSAIEGAAYGLGQSVSEHALGDPDLNAQKVLSNIGYSALFGGALGGTIKAGEIAIPKVVSAAKDSLTKLYDVAVGLPGAEPGLLSKAYAQGSSFVSGKPYEQIVEALQNRTKSLINPEDQVALVKEFADNMQSLNKKVSQSIHEANSSPRIQETASYLKEVPVENVAPEYQRVLRDLKERIKVMRSEPDLYPGSYPRILEQIEERVAKEITSESSAFDVFKKLDDLKGRLDEEIQYGAAPSGGDLRAQNQIGELRRSIKNSLEDQKIWGEAASRQAAFNDAQSGILNLTGKKGLFRKEFMAPALSKGGKQVYEVSPSKIKTYLSQIKDVRGELKSKALTAYLDASDRVLNEIENTYRALPDKAFDKEVVKSVLDKSRSLSEKAIDQSEFNKALAALGGGAHNVPLVEGAAGATAILGHPIIGAALETASMLKAPGLAVQRLAKIERFVQKTTQTIETLSSSIFKAGVSGVKPLAGYAGSALSNEEKNSKYEKKSAQLNDLKASPEKLISALTEATNSMAVHAPQISQGIMSSAATATQFLQSKMPQGANHKPLSSKYVPSDAELSKWYRYFNMVEKPTNALRQVASGTLTSDAMETLKVVYPKLLQDMQKSVTEKMIDAVAKKKSIPYKTKLSLSLFLGSDLVSSLDPVSMLANQNTMASATQAKNDQEQAQKMGSVNAKGLDKLDSSNRLLTASQSSAQRQKQGA